MFRKYKLGECYYPDMIKPNTSQQEEHKQPSEEEIKEYLEIIKNTKSEIFLIRLFKKIIIKSYLFFKYHLNLNYYAPIGIDINFICYLTYEDPARFVINSSKQNVTKLKDVLKEVDYFCESFRCK